ISEDFVCKIDTHEHLPLDVFQDQFVSTFDAELDSEGGVGEIDFDEKEGERLSPGDRTKQIAKMRDAGVNLATVYRNHIGTKIMPVVVESKFTIEVTGVPVDVIGYVDLIGRWAGSDEQRVIERKTVKRKEKRPKADWQGQAMLYQRATGLPVE